MNPNSSYYLEKLIAFVDFYRWRPEHKDAFLDITVGLSLLATLRDALKQSKQEGK